MCEQEREQSPLINETIKTKHYALPRSSLPAYPKCAIKRWLPTAKLIINRVERIWIWRFFIKKLVDEDLKILHRLKFKV
jgi:hypothetical protein